MQIFYTENKQTRQLIFPFLVKERKIEWTGQLFEYNIILFSLKQATILKEDLPGFLFESNRGTRHTFTAETSLGPEFAAGWTSKKTKRLRSKAEAIKQKVKTLAKDIYDSHFKVAQSKPRGVVAQLKDIVEDMSKVKLNFV